MTKRRQIKLRYLSILFLFLTLGLIFFWLNDSFNYNQKVIVTPAKSKLRDDKPPKIKLTSENTSCTKLWHPFIA